MSEPISLLDAATLFIRSLNQAIISDYQLGIFVFGAYQTKKYKEKHIIRIKRDYPERRDYSRLLSQLLAKKVIDYGSAFPENRIFQINNKPKMSPSEIVCTIDPFGYISHFSAMKHYDLSVKTIEGLFYSGLPAQQWKEAAREFMQKELGGLSENLSIYHHEGLPALKQIRLKNIAKLNVTEYSTKELGVFHFVTYNRVRVSSIGRTFLDMLRKPSFCGGMHHVISVFAKHAAQNLNEIFNEIEKYGKPIEKVRTGYILEECCGIKDGISDSWLKFVQRGGSRKLDPTKGYKPTFSERWCISINL